MKEPLVSIIIPTYNEEQDIKRTLEACVSLSYLNKEIIVVDDSQDNTPFLVSRFGKQGVRLIRREKNKNGRCGARNAGILKSRGEILIILNADAILPPDFIERILSHYQKGADYVSVDSEVVNQEHLFPRFTQAEADFCYKGKDYLIGWTEGFSCKREVILKAGMFPMLPGPLILKSGEDGYLVKKMDKLGFRQALDHSIIVKHFAPSNFKGFWQTRKQRVSALAGYFLEQRSLREEIIRSFGRTVISLLQIILVFPILFQAWSISCFSQKGIKDILPFFFVLIIRNTAGALGRWESLIELIFFKLPVFLNARV